MIKIILAMYCIGLLSACDRKPMLYPEVRKDVKYNIVVIEGCEYVTVGVHGFSHKGNCKNYIHTGNR